MIYILASIFSLVPIMQLDLYLPVYIIEHVPSQTLFAWGDFTLSLSSTEIFGWLLGFNGLLFVLLILPITRWFANWNDRNVFILSALMSGFGTFFLGWNTNFWYLFIFTFIFSFGEIVRSPVSQSFISQYAPERARGIFSTDNCISIQLGTTNRYIKYNFRMCFN